MLFEAEGHPQTPGIGARPLCTPRFGTVGNWGAAPDILARGRGPLDSIIGLHFALVPALCESRLPLRDLSGPRLVR
jgi:hypothetical protein